jgi:hypothetical protein
VPGQLGWDLFILDMQEFILFILVSGEKRDIPAQK